MRFLFSIDMVLFLIVSLAGCQSMTTKEFQQQGQAVTDMLGTAARSGIHATAVISSNGAGHIAVGPALTYKAPIDVTLIMSTDIVDLGKGKRKNANIPAVDN